MLRILINTDTGEWRRVEDLRHNEVIVEIEEDQMEYFEALPASGIANYGAVRGKKA